MFWNKKKEVQVKPDFDHLLRVATPGDIVQFMDIGTYLGKQKIYGQFQKVTIVDGKVTGCILYFYSDTYMSWTLHIFCPIDRILSISKGAGEIIPLRKSSGEDFQKLGVIKFVKDIKNE